MYIALAAKSGDFRAILCLKYILPRQVYVRMVVPNVLHAVLREAIERFRRYRRRNETHIGDGSLAASAARGYKTAQGYPQGPRPLIRVFTMQRYLELRGILGRREDISVDPRPGRGPIGVVHRRCAKSIDDHLMIGSFSYLEASKENPAVL